MRRAIIVGSQGQDGSYLFERLASADTEFILGISRGKVQTRGNCPAVADHIDVLHADSIAAVVRAVDPTEVYYLAAYHHSAEDRAAVSRPVDLFHRSYETHAHGLVNVLDAVRSSGAKARVFYAASSHVFGDASVSPQDEQTPFSPRCVYGITKVAGIHCCRHFRRSHGVHASVGILYNHESPRRRPDFLTRKVTRAAVAIARGQESSLVVGDLSARVDWGYAPDFADAMIRILALPGADDYVIATGQTHSVQELIAVAFECVGLDWKRRAREDPSLIVKATPSAPLVGDAGKLRRDTGWSPSVSFEEMVALLVRAEQERSIP